MNINYLVQKSSVKPMSTVLAEVRAQCVQFTSLMLQDVLMDEVDLTGPSGALSSPLLQPLLSQSLPRGFLIELLAKLAPTPDILSKVRQP